MMSTVAATVYTLRRVTDTQASLANFNNPIEDAQTAINALSSAVNGAVNKSSVIQPFQPIASTVSYGDLVYYNATSGLFEPAQALLQATPGDQGQSVQAAAARVVGMVISAPTTSNGVTTASLLTGGFYTDASAVTACLGSQATPGTYYLSPTTAGKAVSATSANTLTQPVLQYMGDGKIALSIFYMAHDSHEHKYVSLQASNWTAVASGAPTGTTFYYDAAADTEFSSLGELTIKTTAIFYNGILQTPDLNQFTIVNNVLYTKLTAAPATGKVIVLNHYPLAYGAPVVRSLTPVAGSPITVSSVSGDIEIDIEDFIDGATSNAGVALSGISGRTLNYTPVISSLTAGAGISLSQDTLGGVTISSSYLIGTPLQATAMDMNGALQQSDTNYIYTVFPSGLNTSVNLYMPICDVPSGASMQVYVWMQTTAGAGTLPVQLYAVPLGTVSSPGILPATHETTNIVLNAPATGTAQYIQSQGYLAITQACLICAKISTTAPATDIKALRMGFKIVNAAGSNSGVSTTSTVVSGVVCSDYTAGQTIPAFTAVYMNSSNSLIYRCDANTASTLDLALGISREAVSAGQIVSYISQGILSSPTLGFTVGTPIYCGANGALTQSTPSNAQYTQKLGIALAANTMQVQIKSAVANT